MKDTETRAESFPYNRLPPIGIEKSSFNFEAFRSFSDKNWKM